MKGPKMQWFQKSKLTASFVAITLVGCQPVGSLRVEVLSRSEIVISIPDRYELEELCYFNLFIHGQGGVLLWEMSPPNRELMPCPRQVTFPEGLPGYVVSGEITSLPPGRYGALVRGANGKSMQREFTVQ